HVDVHVPVVPPRLAVEDREDVTLIGAPELAVALTQLAKPRAGRLRGVVRAAVVPVLGRQAREKAGGPGVVVSRGERTQHEPRAVEAHGPGHLNTHRRYFSSARGASQATLAGARRARASARGHPPAARRASTDR